MSQSSKEISVIVRSQAPKNKKIAFVSGNFNVVHPGHLRLFKFASDCADILVVGINKNIEN